MDTYCVLLIVVCARLAGADVPSSNHTASPARKAKKEAFAAEIKSHLQRSNEDYKGSGERVNRSAIAGARRRALPQPFPHPPHLPLVPPLPPGRRHPLAPPRDEMWRPEGQGKGHVIQLSREGERPRARDMQFRNQNDFDRQALEREKVVVEIEGDEMAEGRQKKPGALTGNFGRDESNIMLEQSLWVSGERVGVGKGKGKRERYVTREEVVKPGRDRGAVAAAGGALMGAPQRQVTLTSGSRRPHLFHGSTVARSFGGVRMTMQGFADADDQPLDKEDPETFGAGVDINWGPTDRDATDVMEGAMETEDALGENSDAKGDEIDGDRERVGRDRKGVDRERERVGGDREGISGGAKGAGRGADRVGVGGQGGEQNKAEKLRDFLRNNKDVLKKFILQKRKQRQMTAIPRPPARDPAPAPASPMTLSTTYTPMTFHPPRAAVGTLTRVAAHGALRQAGEEGGGGGAEGAHDQPLAAQHLDMAPARGSRIIAMRQRGRLCQRNVLMPEGPKYDSKGAVYLLAYNRTRYGGREYAQTRAPQLLLPACCNCCRKSVLGCE